MLMVFVRLLFRIRGRTLHRPPCSFRQWCVLTPRLMVRFHVHRSWSFGFRLKGPVLTTSRRTDSDFVVGVVSAPVSPRASLRCKGLGSYTATQRRGATANLDSRYGAITLNAVCIKKWPRSES